MTPNAHILVVEDEVNIRSALLTMLEKLGHTVRGREPRKRRWRYSKTPPPIW